MAKYTQCKKLWNEIKAAHVGNSWALNVCIRREERFQISVFRFNFKNIQKEDQIQSRINKENMK